MKPAFVVAIDQGTTGTTVLVLDANEVIRGRGYRELPQSFPAPGWVEHDPDAIWDTVRGALDDALSQAGEGSVVAVGITNQRETVVLWERASGRPVAPAIVWQDRRTADLCATLRRQGHEPFVRERTGLLFDPYFSATKVTWLLENIAGLRARAERGEIAFGTIESYLIWRLSEGRAHVTDVSNASRTLLFDIRRLAWSDDLCRLFGVPTAILPAVQPSAGRLAVVRGLAGLPDGVPIAGAAGDQQAALFGQGCWDPGDAKCTYGTGAFLLMNVGEAPVLSDHRLLGTVAWTVDGRTSYALEGSAFVSGALVQWLRDGLGLIGTAAEIEALAASVPDTGGVTIVPALSGLGAPHWRPEARGMIRGITRGTTRAHLARAALEGMALQTVELVRAMEKDAGRALTTLRVDGGAAANDLLMQIQADLLGAEIQRPTMLETTALGAARLAARGVGLVGRSAPRDRAPVARFHPRLGPSEREAALAHWKDAVSKA